MIDIEVKVLQETDLGIQVTDGDRDAWLPKSQIKITESTLPGYSDLITIHVPEWLAMKTELV